MIQRYPRVPAIMMLLALTAFGAGVIFARKGAANVAAGSKLAELRAAVEKPDPKPETWLAYAQALKSRNSFNEAAVAFDQVLKADPYHRDGRLGGAYCRAMLAQQN